MDDRRRRNQHVPVALRIAEIVLEALGRAGDASGMISDEELTAYVACQVWALTGGRQKASMETRLSGEFFASLM